MTVEVKIATEKDRELFKNLLNMYHSELGLYCAEFQDVDDNGYFDAHAADSFLSGDRSVMPIVITAEGRNVGLAVLTVEPYCPSGYEFCIQELYVVGYYRGKGVAEEALGRIFAILPGRYCAAVQKENGRAIKFFKKIAEEYFGAYTEEEYEGEFILFGGDVRTDEHPA